MKKQRKQYAPEEKVAILRRHLLEKEPLSKLCDEMGLKPTVFYRWQKEFFGNATVAGGCAAAGGWLRGTLRPCPPEQCHRLHHAEARARRRQQEIHSERDRKLEEARKQR
jgi:transposase-like protein